MQFSVEIYEAVSPKDPRQRFVAVISWLGLHRASFTYGPTAEEAQRKADGFLTAVKEPTASNMRHYPSDAATISMAETGDDK